MNNLLIDIGNSEIKTALGRGRLVFKIKRAAYRIDKFSDYFKSVLKYKRNEFDLIGISCLNQNMKLDIEKIIYKKYKVFPVFIKPEKGLPVKFNYEISLGNDRVCSTVAAALKYKDKKNILVIDFGTATTYNLISNSIFMGGLITSGIQTSLHSLNSKANLPLTKIRNIKEIISKKTAGNILSGVIHQSLFTTDGVINELRKKYRDIFVICTGGFGEYIYKKSGLIDKYDKNLVLEGINLILNYKKSIS